MKVYVECESWMSRGIKRVVTALKQYRPHSVEIVQKESEADLVVVHMVGDGQRKHWIEPTKPYAVIQYCLRTTEFPNTKDWTQVWHGAQVVWSYYDLMKAIVDDGNESPRINFYHAPLGVDATVFKPTLPRRRTFLIGTSGHIAETEGVTESYAATVHLGRKMFHLGPNLKLGDRVAYAHEVSDAVVADFWSQCSYVAGLRRIEGFELPVLEGLCCGARPIVFNSPHYQWFFHHANLIPEGTTEEVTESLIEVMSRPVRPVTDYERAHIAQTFSWKRLTQGFWEAAL